MIKIILLVTHSFLPLEREVVSDSLRMETIDGKSFIIHQVDERETLYAISRRYHVTVTQILEYNKEADAGLEVGQILKVPFVARPATPRQTNGYHIVGVGETLFSISRMYNLTVDELKSLNNLSDNAISVGQQLVVKRDSVFVKPEVIGNTMVGFHQVAAGETLYSISKTYGVTIQQIKEWNNLSTTSLDIGQMIRVAEPQSTQTTASKDSVVITQPVAGTTETTIRISENVAGTDEVRESGLAELIDGTDGNRKYLALHRTAKVGTILKVKNELNNREVFVRVVGPIPSTGVNDKILIKISKSAFDRLGGIDAKFRVEVTYYK